MPYRWMDASSCFWASESRLLRGWAGSGRMRESSMKKAPASLRRPRNAPASEVSDSGSSGGCWLANVRAAAAMAFAAPLVDTLFNFLEECPGDAGFFAGRGLERDGDAVDDTAFELCQIGDHGVKGKLAEMGAELLQVTLLVGSRPL